MKRREAREKALQVLFQIDVGKVDLDVALEHVLQEEEADRYLLKLIEGVTSNLSEIDLLIQSNLDSWKIERLANIDRNIIRIATYELTDQTEASVPVNAVLNEAIELAKLFGDDQSSKFVNAVLSKIKDTLSTK